MSAHTPPVNSRAHQPAAAVQALRAGAQGRLRARLISEVTQTAECADSHHRASTQKNIAWQLSQPPPRQSWWSTALSMPAEGSKRPVEEGSERAVAADPESNGAATRGPCERALDGQARRSPSTRTKWRAVYKNTWARRRDVDNKSRLRVAYDSNCSCHACSAVDSVWEFLESRAAPSASTRGGVGHQSVLGVAGPRPVRVRGTLLSGEGNRDRLRMLHVQPQRGSAVLENSPRHSRGKNSARSQQVVHTRPESAVRLQSR
jgi:hypothetical protein